jgi:hypothetical protein
MMNQTGGWGIKGKAAKSSLLPSKPVYAFPADAPKAHNPRYAPRIPNNMSLIQAPGITDQWGQYTAKLGKQQKTRTTPFNDYVKGPHYKSAPAPSSKSKAGYAPEDLDHKTETASRVKLLIKAVRDIKAHNPELKKLLSVLLVVFHTLNNRNPTSAELQAIDQTEKVVNGMSAANFAAPDPFVGLHEFFDPAAPAAPVAPVAPVAPAAPADPDAPWSDESIHAVSEVIGFWNMLMPEVKEASDSDEASDEAKPEETKSEEASDKASEEGDEEGDEEGEEGDEEGDESEEDEEANAEDWKVMITYQKPLNNAASDRISRKTWNEIIKSVNGKKNHFKKEDNKETLYNYLMKHPEFYRATVEHLESR